MAFWICEQMINEELLWHRILDAPLHDHTYPCLKIGENGLQVIF
jgi:hypothetical protein